MPFSLDQFMQVFANYNRAVWPLQSLLVCLAVVAVFLALRPNSRSDKIISSLLALFWGWTGIMHNAAIAAMADRVIRLGSGQIIQMRRSEMKARPTELEW
jgi:hypothetical protein